MLVEEDCSISVEVPVLDSLVKLTINFRKGEEVGEAVRSCLHNVGIPVYCEDSVLIAVHTLFQQDAIIPLSGDQVFNATACVNGAHAWAETLKRRNTAWRHVIESSNVPAAQGTADAVSFGQAYHAVVHSSRESCDLLIQMEQTYAVAMAELLERKRQSLAKLQDIQSEEMEARMHTAAALVNRTTDGMGDDRSIQAQAKIQQLVGLHMAQVEKTEQAWQEKVNALRIQQRTDFREFVADMFVNMESNNAKTVQSTNGKITPKSAAAAGASTSAGTSTSSPSTLPSTATTVSTAHHEHERPASQMSDVSSETSGRSAPSPRVSGPRWLLGSLGLGGGGGTPSAASSTSAGSATPLASADGTARPRGWSIVPRGRRSSDESRSVAASHSSHGDRNNAASPFQFTEDGHAETFTVYLGSQLRTACNLKLAVVDPIARCRYDVSDIGVSVAQRVETALFLYSDSLTGIVMMRPVPATTPVPLVSEVLFTPFAELCDLSTEFHFTSAEEQITEAIDGLQGVPLKSGDVLMTKHSNLCGVHVAFHLFGDLSDDVALVQATGRTLSGLRNVLAATARFDICRIAVPLFLFESGTLTETFMKTPEAEAILLKRADATFKCVKAFLMENANMSHGLQTIEFTVPTAAAGLFGKVRGLLTQLFRVS